MTIVAFASDKGITIIANTSAPVNALTPEEIKDIYLLKQLTWSDASPIIVLNRKAGSTERQYFEQKLGISSKKYALYLARMHYKGIALPLIQDSRQATLAFVKKVPGTIAYIEGTIPDADEEVKVLGYLK